MNKQRAKRIAELNEALSAIRSELESIRDDESEYFENMPESLQGGDNGERSQSAIDALENAIGECESAESSLEENGY